ncbi:MAG: sugar phosphate isomerase/epimerase [Chloroflexota bacterium]
MNTAVRVANAPCSWGIIEHEIGRPGTPTYDVMLDQLRAAGYAGTELGDWGFMPTDPARLRDELDARAIALVGAFVPVSAEDPASHRDGIDRALRTARLLAAAARGTDWSPVIVLSGSIDNGTLRSNSAGRIRPEDGLTSEQWPSFAHGMGEIARCVRAETGLASGIHPHCGSYVETVAEIDQVLERTADGCLGLVLDTGHVTFGSGQNDEGPVLEVLRRHADRLVHVHFKDCCPETAVRSRQEAWTYPRSVGGGVFCELGSGGVDFSRVTDALRDLSYSGWIVVEQDVLPGMGTPFESACRSREYLARIGL